ncbi:MAG: GNAT family N-acetyltransferase [Nitrososphaerales archaeon]
MNELEFCSYWVKNYQIDLSTNIFVNSDFPDDYFFNRIISKASKSKVINEGISNSKVFLTENALRGFFHLQNLNKQVIKHLEKNHFHYIDTIYTLVSPSKIVKLYKKGPSVNVKETNNIKDWNDIFCKSFRITRRITHVKQVLYKNRERFIFLLAEVSEKTNNRKIPVGCCLLFENYGCMGLYCLGTIPEYRNKGIARTVIKKCLETANLKGFSNVFLHTLLNDDYMNFYNKLNFKIVDKSTIFSFG